MLEQPDNFDVLFAKYLFWLKGLILSDDSSLSLKNVCWAPPIEFNNSLFAISAAVVTRTELNSTLTDVISFYRPMVFPMQIHSSFLIQCFRSASLPRLASSRGSWWFYRSSSQFYKEICDNVAISDTWGLKPWSKGSYRCLNTIPWKPINAGFGNFCLPSLKPVRHIQ